MEQIYKHVYYTQSLKINTFCFIFSHRPSQAIQVIYCWSNFLAAFNLLVMAVATLCRVATFVSSVFLICFFSCSQNPVVVPKTGKQKTGEENSNEGSSVQGKYVQLLPITSIGYSSGSTNNTTSSQDYMALSPSTRSWEVPRNKIRVDKVIGKGAFGQVAKGTAVDLPGNKRKTTVAIKMLKGILVINALYLCGPLVNRKLVILLNQL